MLLRKKFALSPKLRYPLAVFFIVFPALGLGIAGSMAIRGLEAEPDIRFRAAHAGAQAARQAIKDRLNNLVPEIVPKADPTPEEMEAERLRLASENKERAKGNTEATHAVAIGVENVPLGKILARQRAAILEDNRGLIEGAINFMGSIQASWYFRDESRRSAIDPFEESLLVEAARQTVAQAKTRAEMRRVVTFVLDGASGFGRRLSVMLELGDRGLTTLSNRWWCAYIIDEERLASIAQDYLITTELDEPIALSLAQPSSISLDKEPSLEYRFAFDHEMLPGYMVVARTDEEALSIGGKEWRSRFYIFFLVIAVPLLAGILWYIEVVVRREIEDARHKVDFVANVSHELKTPLTSIRMFIEMLLMGRSNSKEEARESLQIILRESERLGRLIDRLLDFNRLDRKTKVFDMDPVNLQEIVRETVKIYRAEEAVSQERLITLAIEPGLPRIDGDRDALREVILNLLANADKYSPRDRPININLGLEGRWVILQVIDQGQGIPARYQTRIFEKFYRVNDALSRQVEGTGLGLAISQQIAKAHGGIIEVESTVGQGSCFTLRMPLASDDEFDDLLDNDES